MTEQLEIWAAYNDTAGYVNRPASKQRAMQELNGGVLGKRQQAILDVLDAAGANGMTWKELGDQLGLHHGKISGALSNMHLFGVVFMLRLTKDRCHPYVHAKFRDEWTAEARYDEPAKTRTSERKELLEQLLSVCRKAVGEDFLYYASINDIIESVDMIDAHDRQLETKG